MLYTRNKNLRMLKVGKEFIANLVTPIPIPSGGEGDERGDRDGAYM